MVSPVQGAPPEAEARRVAANAGLRGRLQALYEGESRRATRFRYALIGFDLLTIAFFIVTTPLGLTTGVVVADLAIGAAILAELLARLWIAPRPLKMLRQIHTLIDIVVVASLLLAPILTESLAFLRVLRTLRLLRSYRVLHDLRSEAPFFRRNEDVIVSAVNLGVFVFLVTAGQSSS
jgi:voltage-gated potassium channel